MAVDITSMRAYTDGAVYTHAVGASPTAPTDASTSLNVGFLEVGAVSEDGITEATSQDRTDVVIWQKNTVARRLPGTAAKTFQFAAAETRIFNLGLQYPGSTVTTTGEGAAVSESAPQTDIRRWVLHGLDGASRKLRLYLPFGEITDRGDVVWSANGVTVFDWTITAYPDTSGFWVYRYYAGISA
jgi:hypothetical protein